MLKTTEKYGEATGKAGEVEYTVTFNLGAYAKNLRMQNRTLYPNDKIVFYDDGSINDTPEDRGTFNVYYGDNPFGKYVIHGIFDVVPYMLWGNSLDDKTTIIDRVMRCFQ